MMKRLLLCAAICLMAAVPVQGGEKLTFSAIEATFNTRISTQVMTEAYRRMGIEISVAEYPGKRALLYANLGETDGELFRIAGIEERYRNLIRVPVVINRLDGMVYTKGMHFPVDGWESLRPYRVGVRRGILYSEKGTSGMGPFVANSYEGLFDALDKGVVDLAVMPRVNGLANWEKLQTMGIRMLEPPVHSEPMYHYLHKRHAELAPALTKALRQMEEEGLIQGIRERSLSTLRGAPGQGSP